MTTQSITSGQGHQLVEFAVNAARKGAMEAVAEIGPDLDKDDGQQVLERGDDFSAIIRAATIKAIRGLSSRNRYADQVVTSTYTYPPKYAKGMSPIASQVESLLAEFPGLNAKWALTKGQAWYDSVKPGFPEWVEGPLVYVWYEAFGGYITAVEKVFERLAANWNFYNYRAGQIDADHFRQLERTARMEKVLKATQPGDFLIAPQQAGLYHRGQSVLYAREVFGAREFGLGTVAEGCRALTAKSRYVRWEQLHTDVAGDKFSPGAGGGFSKAPFLSFDDGELGFSTDHVSRPDRHYGSSSALLP